MTEALRLLLLNHATGKTVWTPPEQWYIAYFLAGVEMTGGGYERQPIDFADAVALTSSNARAGSSDSQMFVNLPDDDADELRIVDTASGAITLTGWIIPHLRSFTAGEDRGYPVDGIGVNLAAV